MEQKERFTHIEEMVQNKRVTQREVQIVQKGKERGTHDAGGKCSS